MSWTHCFTETAQPVFTSGLHEPMKGTMATNIEEAEKVQELDAELTLSLSRSVLMDQDASRRKEIKTTGLNPCRIPE